MRVWLDDVRPMPADFDVHCRTADCAIALIGSYLVDHISFDHDLGSEDTGYDVAKVIEEMAADGECGPPTYAIHSANPVGRKNIEDAMQNAQKLWRKV